VKKTLLDKLETLDRRWIFLAMGIAVAIPIFFHLGLVPEPSPPVKAFYEAIENLPPNSRVLCSFDYDPGSRAEMEPMSVAVLRHLLMRGHKPVVITLWQTAPSMIEGVCNRVCGREFHKEYGKDYVYLGLKEGREAVMVAMGRSIRDAYPEDFYGTPIGELPLMQDVENYSSFALLVNVSAGYPGTKEYVQYVEARFDIPLISGASAVSVPEFAAYFQAGQLEGLLTGMTGAAEYEALIQKPDVAVLAMDGQTIGHFVVIAFIVLGNLVFLINRRRKA
jgi:hypothetical protein